LCFGFLHAFILLGIFIKTDPKHGNSFANEAGLLSAFTFFLLLILGLLAYLSVTKTSKKAKKVVAEFLVGGSLDFLFRYTFTYTFSLQGSKRIFQSF